MASLKTSLPSKRTIVFLIIVLAILSCFLLPYVFFFIPANESSLQQQAFSKLKQATVNIINRNTDTRNYLKNLRRDILPADKINKGLGCRHDTSKDLQDSIFFKFENNDGWHIVYLFDTVKNKKSIYYGDALLASLVDPSIASSKELFQTRFIVDFCNKDSDGHKNDPTGIIIFQDSATGLETEVNIDSLIPRTQGIRAPAIIDLTIQGIEYKLFSYPFTISRHHLILCSLIKTSVYRARVHVMPASVFYGLLICIILFILSLPFLKIFMMNDQDHLLKSDLVSGSRFLFALATFLTLVMVQLFLLMKSHYDVQYNLKCIGTKMSDSLSNELKLGVLQLNKFDSLLNQYISSKEYRDQIDPVTIKHYMDARNSQAGIAQNTVLLHITTADGYTGFLSGDHPDFYLDSNCHDFRDEIHNRLLYSEPDYQNFDHAAWVSNAGKESIRAEFLGSDSVAHYDPCHEKPKNFVDVNSRDYYKYLKRLNETDSLADSLVYLAPVYSWANREFMVNICRKTKLRGMFLELLQTRLYSLVNTAISAGYGFCLIQADGRVLIHSDTLKNLRENFLDETLRSAWINEAISTRQSDYSFGVPLYGKNYSLRIQPLKQTPLFLVTFYDNDNIGPVILRILSFSLFCCMLSYILLFLITLFIYPRRARSFLFSSTDYFSWLVPRKDQERFYFNGSLFIVLYLFILFIYSLLIRRNLNNLDHSFLVVALITPFNLLFALRLLRRTIRYNNTGNAVLNILIPPAVCLIIYAISKFSDGHIHYSFWILEGIIILFIFSAAWHNGKYWLNKSDKLKYRIQENRNWIKYTRTTRKLYAYSCFISLLIAGIAIMPAFIYSWFAYGHEIVQSVKKEQLNMARSIYSREPGIKKFLRIGHTEHNMDSGLLKMIQYQKGIYSIYGDIISNKEKNDSTTPSSESYGYHSESFYNDLISTIGFKHYDPTGFQTLTTSNQEDNLWNWNFSEDSSYFEYSPPRWRIPPVSADDARPAVYIKIKSTFPPALNHVFPVALLILIAIVFGLFWLIQNLAKRVFMLHVVGEIDEKIEMGAKDDTGVWKKCFNLTKAIPVIHKAFDDSLQLKNKLISENEHPDIFKDKFLFDEEIELSKRAIDLKPLFDCVWKKCTNQEKFLLTGLAEDGLLNYKNEALIYKLFLDKLLIVHKERVKLISYSFRLYIISKKGTREEKEFIAKMKTGGSWGSMKNIFFVVILSILVFLFLTQQEVSGKIVALITGLSTIIPLLLKFGLGGSQEPAKK